MATELLCGASFECYGCGQKFLCSDFHGHPWLEHQSGNHRSHIE